MSRPVRETWRITAKQLVRKEFDTPIILQGRCVGDLRERNKTLVEFTYRGPYPFYTHRTIIFKRSVDATNFARWVVDASRTLNEDNLAYQAKQAREKQ
jgi:hypothetical protein